jgi:hypothetical protein
MITLAPFTVRNIFLPFVTGQIARRSSPCLFETGKKKKKKKKKEKEKRRLFIMTVNKLDARVQRMSRDILLT